MFVEILSSVFQCVICVPAPLCIPHSLKPQTEKKDRRVNNSSPPWLGRNSKKCDMNCICPKHWHYALSSAWPRDNHTLILILIIDKHERTEHKSLLKFRYRLSTTMSTVRDFGWIEYWINHIEMDNKGYTKQAIKVRVKKHVERDLIHWPSETFSSRGGQDRPSLVLDWPRLARVVTTTDI